MGMDHLVHRMLYGTEFVAVISYLIFISPTFGTTTDNPVVSTRPTPISEITTLSQYAGISNITTAEILTESESTTEQTRIPLYVLGLLPYSGAWPVGPTSRRVNQVALDHINSDPNVLAGYELKVFWEDTECLPGVGANKLIKALYTPPTKVMILGDSCSIVNIGIADIAPFYNLIQVSPDASAPTLSDKTRFPNFFRMWPPATSRNAPRIDFLKEFNWKKVATITQLYVSFSTAMDDFIAKLEPENITLLTSEIYQDNPVKTIEAIKAVDARIIIGNFWEPAARRLLCQAYKSGIYGAKYVWHLIGWYANDWWAVAEPGVVDCTLEQMRAVTEGTVYVSAAMEPVLADRMSVSGYTARQVNALVWQDGLVGIQERFYFYDMVWSGALALNESIGRLAAIGKQLTDFTYDDNVTSYIIKDALQRQVFEGSLGLRQYDQKGDSKVHYEIKYQTNGTREHVGTYVYNADGRAEIVWVHSNRINWIGGRVPSDSTREMVLPRYINLNVFIGLAILAALGIAFAVLFLAINVIFREKKLIKMSSPKMNNLILLGCILVFGTVFFFEQDHQLTHIFCTVRVFTLAIGFSLSFGSLFSKTWRVHVIFTSKKVKSVNIQDRTLFLIVMLIVVVNTTILTIWMAIDPFKTTFVTIREPVLNSAEDVVILYRVAVCRSSHGDIFTGILYVIQGIMLLFGAFLAWQTRKVSVPGLNDSQLIGTCIYNVFILSALGVGLGYVLSKEIHLVSILNSAFMILGTFCTQCTIFFPKVLSLIRGQADVAPSTMHTESTSNTSA